MTIRSSTALPDEVAALIAEWDDDEDHADNEKHSDKASAGSFEDLLSIPGADNVCKLSESSDESEFVGELRLNSIINVFR